MHFYVGRERGGSCTYNITIDTRIQMRERILSAFKIMNFMYEQRIINIIAKQ